MAPFAPGIVLGGRYELGRLVSDDGLSVEWTATDRVLARGVTVEALSPDADDQGRAAFVAALAAGARVANPGVVATYDSGTAPGGLPYVVTERPSGASLGDLVERWGQLPPPRVVAIGRQAARALEAAHRAGVVHGAVGPDTVTVNEDDRVKLRRFASAGARARLAGTPTPADDVAALATTLRGLGADAPPALAAALAAPTDAAALAHSLDGIALETPDPTPSTPLPITRRSGSRPASLAGVIVGLILVAGIAAAAFALVNRGSTTGSPSTGTTLPGQGRGGDYPVSVVHSFNPLGDSPTENEALAAKAVDGDPSTVWSTSDYRNRDFGNLKKGTGLVVTLDKSHTLHQLTVTSPDHGWTFSVYVAPQAAGSLAAWGNPVTSTTVTSDVTQVDLTGQSGADILVWITDLGPQGHSGLAAFPYRVDIGEVAVR